MMMLRIAAIALPLLDAPLAAQDAPDDHQARLWVQLRMAENAFQSLDMKADVMLATQVEPHGLTVRVRTTAGTLECYNDFTLYPEGRAELGCVGVYPSHPPLSAVSGVTAEAEARSMPELEAEVGRLALLFAPAVGFRCEEVPREEVRALSHSGELRVFGCKLREPPSLL